MAGSSFWLGEYDLDTISGQPEAAVADSVLAWAPADRLSAPVACWRSFKLRGSTYLSGRHSYRINAAGLNVFPRLADTVDASNLRPRCPASINRHRGSERDAHEWLLARLVNAVRRAVGHRKDAHGTALHRRRR